MGIETQTRTQITTRLGDRTAVRQLRVVADLLGVPPEFIRVEKRRGQWPDNQSTTAPVEVFDAHALVDEALNPQGTPSFANMKATLSTRYYRNRATQVLRDAGKI